MSSVIAYYIHDDELEVKASGKWGNSEVVGFICKFTFLACVVQTRLLFKQTDDITFLFLQPQMIWQAELTGDTISWPKLSWDGPIHNAATFKE